MNWTYPELVKGLSKSLWTPHIQHTFLNCYRLVDATELWAPERPDTETVSSPKQSISLDMEHTTLLYNYVFTTHIYIFFISNLHMSDPCVRHMNHSFIHSDSHSQNIDTLGPIWTFSLRGVITFVASGLDNGCVELFWGDSKFTLLYKLYTSCHFFSVVTWKDIKYLQKYEECTHFCEILCVCVYIYIYT